MHGKQCCDVLWCIVRFSMVIAWLYMVWRMVCCGMPKSSTAMYDMQVAVYGIAWCSVV